MNKTITLQENWTLTIEDGSCNLAFIREVPAEEPAEVDSGTTETNDTNVSYVTEVSFDLSQYSDEEILELAKSVNQEIVARNMAKSAQIPSGNYIVGVDIPAGKYVVKPKGSLYSGVWFYIYTDSTKNMLLQDDYLSSGETCAITLEEGNLVRLDGDATFTVFTGIAFN